MTHSQNSVLHLDHVGVSYGKIPVVEDISLDIRAGETFGLIGLNGSGKTTLIKTMLGLRAHNTGTVKVLGSPPADKKARSSLAYLPERFEPPWFLSGMEFLKFSFDLYKRPFDQERVLKNAEFLELDTRALGRRVETYSKGMRQKLGLLGTILTDCPFMILDEPMSGLDPMARVHVKDMILRSRSEDRTIFLSSHILADMDDICDRIAILHGGRIRYQGTPAALREKMAAQTLERAFLDFIEEESKA